MRGGWPVKKTLDRALASISGPLVGLRAVVLSAAPDGILAWSWSSDERHEAALGFVALDRAATICLEGLGASQSSRCLLLSAEDTWVASWPLFDASADVGRGRERLVITTVFSGALQSGMVMVYGSRVRMQIRAALAVARTSELIELRSSLARALVAAAAPELALRELCAAADVELSRLQRLEDLSSEERRRLIAGARGHAPMSLVWPSQRTH